MIQLNPQSDTSARQCPETSWTMVANAKDLGSPAARRALADLCQAYWYPLYAFLRRTGESPDRAEDLLQGFFADILGRDFLRDVEPSKGRFRSFLLASLSHFVNNRRDWEQREKRGGKIRHVSIDLRDAEGRYVIEVAHRATPERLFERRWALTVLNRVLEALEAELRRAGKGRLFDRLKGSLVGGRDAARYAEIAAELGMTERAVNQESYRIRKRYRAMICEEVGRTVADPADVDREIADLFDALRL